ncbi:Uncharacterised protein [Amycolatopsis camponoti]|uniref:Uncharacterized protein n=1 Tax=Amycolatopsis camponoti TaxID=2606593 RepID=A0A6I8LJC7_9PSEU|nr:Uncharacterised protein [Amycolatopsis camponoti]
MNGVRFAPLTKNRPTASTSTQTATFTQTSRLVSQADSLMPSTATTVSTAMISTAPTFTFASSPNHSGDSPSRLAR